MSKAHERKKQPEQVRRLLLENTVRIAGQRGYEAVTIQAVANASGVTKGGLMHHFPSKKELVTAAFQHITDHFERELNQHLEGQPHTYGVLTRAYIRCCIRPVTPDEQIATRAILIFMFSEPELKNIWTRSYEAWFAHFADTDAHLELELIRFAADGIWMELLLDPDRWSQLAPLVHQLVQRTNTPA